MCISQAVQCTSSSDAIFILQELRAAEPCTGGGGVREGVAKCLGGFGCRATCNPHLPLGTRATHGVGARHTCGAVGSWYETPPPTVIGLLVGESRWQLGAWRASAEESGPDHLVSLGLPQLH